MRNRSTMVVLSGEVGNAQTVSSLTLESTFLKTLLITRPPNHRRYLRMIKSWAIELHLKLLPILRTGDYAAALLLPILRYRSPIITVILHQVKLYTHTSGQNTNPSHPMQNAKRRIGKSEKPTFHLIQCLHSFPIQSVRETETPTSQLAASTCACSQTLGWSELAGSFPGSGIHQDNLDGKWQDRACSRGALASSSATDTDDTRCLGTAVMRSCEEEVFRGGFGSRRRG
jgi:hypothetical protein